MIRSGARNVCFYALLLWVAFSAAAFAKDNPSYTQVERNINVGPDDKVGDLTCFGCNIHIRGEVAGDVMTFGGSVSVEDQAQVAGDVSIFGGDARLDRGARVAGDVSVFGGRIHRDPLAAISGDVAAFGGHGWLLPILLTPIVLLGLLAALIVWIIQRARRPSLPAAAA